MISKDKNFNDDKLERQTFITNTMNIINEWYKTFPTEDSVVIAINAGWGNGKSYLLNMWKKWILSSDEKPANYSVVSYNAWENDDQINAFLPLAYEIKNIEIYGDDYLLTQRIANGGKEFIKACSIALLKDGTKKIIGEETSKILIEGIDGFKEGKIESYFENYKFIKTKKKYSERP